MSATAPSLAPAEAQKLGTTAAPASGIENQVNQEEARWRPVLGLPCQLTVDLPLPNFRVADFLGLRRGSVIGTNWRTAHDVPLRINGTLIGWAEFEGAGRRLAVRLTELA